VGPIGKVKKKRPALAEANYSIPHLPTPGGKLEKKKGPGKKLPVHTNLNSFAVSGRRALKETGNSKGWGGGLRKTSLTEDSLATRGDPGRKETLYLGNARLVPKANPKGGNQRARQREHMREAQNPRGNTPITQDKGSDSLKKAGTSPPRERPWTSRSAVP